MAAPDQKKNLLDVLLYKPSFGEREHLDIYY